MPTTSRNQRRRQPTRTGQSTTTKPRRSVTRTAEPLNYPREYAYVARDLRVIALIGGLLLIGMIAAAFVL